DVDALGQPGHRPIPAEPVGRDVEPLARAEAEDRAAAGEVVQREHGLGQHGGGRRDVSLAEDRPSPLGARQGGRYMPTRPGFWMTPNDGSNTRCRRRYTGRANPGHMTLMPSSKASSVSRRKRWSRPFSPGITAPMTCRFVPAGEQDGSIA